MIIKVYHSRLQSADSHSHYRKECPFCDRGIFLVGRNRETHILEEYDCCISCGQQVLYLDIEQMRKRENGS